MWIDASDEIPKRGQDVLCWLGDNWYVVGFHNGEWWTDGEYNDIPVKYWQPLPGPPRPKVKQQPPMTCGNCENWEEGECTNSHSPKFTDTTSATDGCTPNKQGRADWI